MLDIVRTLAWVNTIVQESPYSASAAIKASRSAAYEESHFSGQAGGWPKRFGELVKGENQGSPSPIKVEIAPDLSKWSVEIPADNILAAAEALLGPTSDGKVTKSTTCRARRPVRAA